MAAAYCAVFGVIAKNLSNNPQAQVQPQAAKIDLKGKYKIEEAKSDCPICANEGVDVVKPFKCEHALCEECLEGMCKANAAGNDHEMLAYINGVGNALIRNHYDINLVCPQCREALREPTKTPQAQEPQAAGVPAQV